VSVPSSRMVARTPAPTGDPTRIMGVPKPVFWVIVIVGGILAFYLIKKSGSGSGSQSQQEMFPTGGDWAADDLANSGGGGSSGLTAAGLPNMPGTNANPNPEPISDPTSQSGDPSGPYTTFTPTNPYNPNYVSPTVANPVPTYIAPPTAGSGGAYTTGPGTPTSGGAITGRGVQGGF
jgi:hypothetical protein